MGNKVGDMNGFDGHLASLGNWEEEEGKGFNA